MVLVLVMIISNSRSCGNGIRQSGVSSSSESCGNGMNDVISRSRSCGIGISFISIRNGR